MGFQEILNVLLDRSKGSAALLITLDGIPIESLEREAGLDLEAASAEYAFLLREAEPIGGELGLGRTLGLSILAEDFTLSFALPTNGYALGLLTRPLAGFARARYALCLAAPEVVKEL